MPQKNKNKPRIYVKTNSPLTLKQTGFVKSLVAGKAQDPAQAILDNYDTVSPNVARVMATENLQKPSIQNEILRLTRQSGFGPDRAVAKLCKMADDDDNVNWALRLWFDVTGYKAATKEEHTHKIEYSDEENTELSNLRRCIEGGECAT